MKKIILLISFILLILPLSAINVDEKYSLIEQWGSKDNNGTIIISGEIRIQITILKIEKNNISIRIQKDMTPFGQILDFNAKAYYTNSKYEYECIDNWGNKSFGYLILKNDRLIFLLDCNEFSEDGKNLGRLYGDKYVLRKGKIKLGLRTFVWVSPIKFQKAIMIYPLYERELLS